MKQIVTALAVAAVLAGTAVADRVPVPAKSRRPSSTPTVIGCRARTDGIEGWACREVRYPTFKAGAKPQTVATYLFVNGQDKYGNPLLIGARFVK